jgi:YHS domain-containing protein
VVRLLLLFLLGLMLLRAVWRLFDGLVQGASGDASRRSGRVPPAGPRMVKDPVCGTYVVPERALAAAFGRDTQYFCSEDCRRKWRASL